ncbi:MAG: sugar transporter [Paludibacteraceae bacterium]|nr:sugar transporter [Paludibacteraceae bacterium]
MSNESRVQKAVLNMKVNMVACFIAIIVSFLTRKVFLDQLGSEFIGLTTTINSLLAFLNLAELGVGASIAYFLYKPLFDDDKEKINEIISIMQYLYRIIGFVILSAGIILSFFLPIIFTESNEYSWFTIYYCFYAQLACSLIGYFVNYKANTIFNADQRQYLVNGYFQATQLLCTLLQMLIALYTRSYFLYITATLLFAIINSFILNWKFKQVYDWVNSSFERGKEAIKHHNEIIQYVKRVFIHQIGAFINNSVMPIIIYAFASLTMVTCYGNYILINTKVSQLINAALSGTSAGIGNLIAEGKKEQIYRCYKELYAIKFYVVTYLSICLVYLNSDLIAVWLGREYVLEPVIVLLICADFCLNLLRNTTDQYLDGYGLKADVWVPVCRIISLLFVFLAGKMWGIVGLLAVPVVVQLCLMHVWKPYYLYRQGFNRNFLEYIKLLALNTMPFIIAFLVAKYALVGLGIAQELTTTWRAFIIKAALFCTLLFVSSALLSYLFSEGTRLFCHRIRERLKGK